MKVLKLRSIITKGAIRICYTEDGERLSKSFRSMDAVPDSFDKCKVKDVTARDDIEITFKDETEPKKVRGFQIILEEMESKKKKKKHKKKMDISKLEGTDEDLYVDPSLEKDPIDKKLK